MPHLQRALARETVSWVRGALQRVLDRFARGDRPATGSEDIEDVVTDAVVSDVYLRASEEILSTLLHEIQPRIGYIRNAAAREIPDFQKSDTLREIETLEKLLTLLAQLRRVSQTATSVSFDLADLIDEVVAELDGRIVQLAGQKPMIVFGEPTSVRLAVANGLRNAIEATRGVDDGVDRRVVVNWGADDERYWISIVDQGAGIRGSVEGMFEIGRTTKLDHFGMGLPLAKQAMLAVGGHVTLVPGAQGGARFEVNWEKFTTEDEANTS
jgi:signal transduction histidine kinase